MAIKNSLAKKKTQIFENVQTAVYEVGGQKVELSPEVVRNYMVSGNKEAVSIDEIVMFMNLCKFSGLNPWAKEAYCIKYGKEPATMVIGKEAYLKRAEAHEAFDGYECGVILWDKNSQEIVYRQGSVRLASEDVVGGWAKVYRKDRSHPYVAEVGFDEYAARRSDGSLNAMWTKKPGTMIRKTALVQALREAFPSAFGGAFSTDEGDAITEADVYVPEQTQVIEQKEEPVVVEEVKEAEVVHAEEPFFA